MPTTLQEIIDAHAEYARLARSATLDFLPAYFAPVFDADPRVKAIVWGQWAPYFNDGEPCRFGVHNEIMVRGLTRDPPRPYEGEEEDPLVGDSSHYSDYWEVNKAAAGLLAAIPLGILERFCEDGVIQVTRDGVQVFDYSHD